LRHTIAHTDGLRQGRILKQLSTLSIPDASVSWLGKLGSGGVQVCQQPDPHAVWLESSGGHRASEADVNLRRAPTLNGCVTKLLKEKAASGETALLFKVNPSFWDLLGRIKTTWIFSFKVWLAG
jgi:hypothetical protein